MKKATLFLCLLALSLELSCSSAPPQPAPQAGPEPVEAVAEAAPEPAEAAPAVEPQEPEAEEPVEVTEEPAAAPPPPETAPPPRQISWSAPSPIAVALYRAPGVSVESHIATHEVLEEAGGFRPALITPEQVRDGALSEFHVVLFTGGRGSVQGEALAPEGRQLVRDFVSSGGGYIGVCAGSYLAMQGAEEFHKLAIVAAQNLSGDAWRRGTHTLVIREVGGEALHRLFYANGPVFQPIEHEELPQVRPLAIYVSDAFLPRHGTNRGEMPGTPAIIASHYGHGRIVLFSPNPVLSAEGESAEPALMVSAVRWVATPEAVPDSLEFGDVFR